MERGHVHIDRKSEETFLWADNDTTDPRSTTVGKLYVVCMADIASGSPFGLINFHWTVDLALEQEAQDIPQGDAACFTFVNPASSPMSTTQRMGGTSSTYAGWPGNSIEYSIVDSRNGQITMPAGFYVMNFTISNGTGLAVSGTNIDVRSPGLVDQTKTSQALDTSGGAGAHIIVTTVWAYSTQAFSVYLGTAMTAGTWTSVRFTANATTKSPIVTSMRLLREILRQQSLTAAIAEKVDMVKRDSIVEKTTTEDDKKENCVVVEDYVMAGSTSSAMVSRAKSISSRPPIRM